MQKVNKMAIVSLQLVTSKIIKITYMVTRCCICTW